MSKNLSNTDRIDTIDANHSAINSYANVCIDAYRYESTCCYDYFDLCRSIRNLYETV